MLVESNSVQHQAIAHQYIFCAPERGIQPQDGDQAKIRIPPASRVLFGTIEVDSAFDTLSTLDVGVEGDLGRFATNIPLDIAGTTFLIGLPQKFINGTSIIITFNNDTASIGEATVRVGYEVDGRTQRIQ